MAGTVTLSLQQLFDELGNVLSNGRVYFIQAGTTSTPQNSYQDFGLTNPWPNPFILESDGRLPLLYFADGFIKVRMVDESGASQVVQDNIPVLGSSSGGGGGGTIDPTTIIQTGDIKLMYNFGVLAGFVRANGRTIGSVTSGATERANADTQALFVLLWTVDPNLAVSGGRGASAAADWAANKTIALPDLRHRVPAGLGDMGNTNVGLLSSIYFSGGSTTALGVSGGAQQTVLVNSNLPPYTPAGTVSGASSGADTILVNGNTGQSLGAGTTGFGWSNSPTVKAIAAALSWAGSFVGTPQGGISDPFRTVQPTILITFYVKL